MLEAGGLVVVYTVQVLDLVVRIGQGRTGPVLDFAAVQGSEYAERCTQAVGVDLPDGVDLAVVVDLAVGVGIAQEWNPQHAGWEFPTDFPAS